MSKLIITTVGTSTLDKIKNGKIAINENIDKLAEGKPLPQQIRLKVIKETVEGIKEYIDNNKSYSFLPAEIASLMVFKNNEDLGLCADDMIALFATDTEDGKFCAEVIKKVLDELKWCNVLMPKVITGLKTQNTKEDKNISQMFIEAGKDNLKKEVEKLLKNPEYTDNYFNITGGFKGVIPFATIIAFNNRTHLMYLYEKSDDLIIIGPPNDFKYPFDHITPKAHHMDKERADL